MAFVPTDISGCILWLKADQITASDNDAIGTWSDQSGNANDATQATAGKKPVYKTGILNGLPILRFTAGNSSCLQVASLTMGPLTIFFVTRMTAAGIICEQSANSNRGFNAGSYFYGSSGFASNVNRGGSANTLRQLATNWAVDSAWRIYIQTFNGNHADHILYKRRDNLNATDGDFTDNPGTGTVTDAFNIHSRNQASLFPTCDTAEIVVYNSALSTANRELVDLYLEDKYAIPPPVYLWQQRGAQGPLIAQ